MYGKILFISCTLLPAVTAAYHVFNLSASSSSSSSPAGTACRRDNNTRQCRISRIFATQLRLGKRVSTRQPKTKQKMKQLSLESLLDVEMELRARGYRYIIGVDDTGGAGCIAGPIVVASCCLLKPIPWLQPIETESSTDHIVSQSAVKTMSMVNDCKVLTREQRQEIYDTVQSYPDVFAVSIIQRSPEQVDELNISRATQEAFAESIETLVDEYKLPHGEVYAIVDGNVSPKLYAFQRKQYHLLKECEETDLPQSLDIFPVRPYVNGDANVYTVALASIIARVERDAIMDNLHHQHPLYGFAEHAGFGRRDHIEAIHRLGAIEGVHRMSFKQVKGR